MVSTFCTGVVTRRYCRRTQLLTPRVQTQPFWETDPGSRVRFTKNKDFQGLVVVVLVTFGESYLDTRTVFETITVYSYPQTTVGRLVGWGVLKGSSDAHDSRLNEFLPSPPF